MSETPMTAECSARQAETTIRYPALLAYIASRNAGTATAKNWCDQLHLDQADAVNGAFADVAADLARAEQDYAAYAVAKHGPGASTYPYNSAMGEFLGLPICPGNHEPEHGYYMAVQLRHHHALGVARREAQRLIDEGRELRVVVARSKADNKTVRFVRFKGPDQIRIEGNDVRASNGKRGFRFSSNWSVETCLQRIVYALSSGAAYGEAA